MSFEESKNTNVAENPAELYEALFEHNPCQTIVVDNTGKIIKYNKAQSEKAARLPNPGDILFKDYAGGYEHDMHSELIDCINTKQTKDFPDQVYVDNIFAITISPFPGGATIITEDVTERKHAEWNLEKAHEDLKAQDVKKTAFVVNLAHEMRTSLCILNNALSLIDSGAAGKVNKKLAELFVISDRSIKRLAGIVNDFVELSEIEEGKFVLSTDQVDFKNLISETIDRHKDIIKERKIKVKCHEPKTEVFANADADKLSKVFDHILENAVRFVGEKGKIDITVEDHGSDVSVNIEDNGNGIENDKMLEIFESFVKFDVPGSTCPGGMGLGLTLAKGIVELHNGHIHVSSTVGEGSSFQIVIPK